MCVSMITVPDSLVYSLPVRVEALSCDVSRYFLINRFEEGRVTRNNKSRIVSRRWECIDAPMRPEN